jgi:crotonobetainyl-CoA:carnitine CoA-transferase CaiB-like acyl-CoA transferase
MGLAHALPDGIGGLAGALAAVRGLRTRSDTGRGVYVDLSQLETYVSLCGEDIVRTTAHASARGPRGQRPRISGLYRALGDDAWLAIDAVGASVARLASVLTETSGERPASRPPNVDLAQLEARIVDVAARSEPGRLAETLQAAGIAAHPVSRPEDMVADPHLASRRAFAPVTIDGCRGLLPAPPSVGPGIHRQEPGRTPAPGEHTRDVLIALLGLSHDEIDALHQERIVHAAR